MSDNVSGDTPPGLQYERTLLAWNRTLLALVVALALVVRVLGPPYPRLVHAPALLVAAGIAWLWIDADRGARRAGTGTRVAGRVHVTAASVCALAIGLGGVVAILAA